MKNPWILKQSVPQKDKKKKKARKQVNTQENKDTKEASLKAILILYAKEH